MTSPSPALRGGRGRRACPEQPVLSAVEGKSKGLGIFPEGSLSPAQGGFGAPRTGAARLALCTDAPIIPIGIHLDHAGTRDLAIDVEGCTEIARWDFRGPYVVTIGTPMYFDGNVEDRPYVREISARLMENIARLSRESAQRVEAATAPQLAPSREVGVGACS